MNGFFLRVTSRALATAVVVSAAFGPTAVFADDESLGLLSAEQRAYVESTQGALAYAFNAIDVVESATGFWRIDSAFDDDSATSRMAMVLDVAKSVLSDVASILSQTPPTSMSGLGSINMEAAEAFENAYVACSEMLIARSANDPRQGIDDAIEDLLSFPTKDAKAGVAARARFLACVSSESARVKHHGFIVQDALTTRVDEIMKEEGLERELLGDQGGAMCFIATAAYGTNSAEEIDVLRDFRDEVLLKSAAGRDYVDFYYVASPPLAQFIAEHEWLRTIMREVYIDPLVAVVRATDRLWFPSHP